jgi:hypothetical protein
MIKVYIAGPYRAPDILSILDNIRHGIRAATEALRLGVAVYCPWLDFMLHLMLMPGETLDVETYQANSIEWLHAADCLLALPGYEHSAGTQAEIKLATSLNLPIFYNFNELIDYKFSMDIKC